MPLAARPVDNLADAGTFELTRELNRANKAASL